MLNPRWIGALSCLLLAASGLSAQGIVLPAVGPVNRSMGGVATAAPLDASGAIHWNPATITALGNRVDIGAEMLSSRHKLSSTVGPVSGTTSSEGGLPALPAVNLVYRTSPESNVTYGLGLNAVGGFFVNFPGSTTNPLLTSPSAGGIGPLFSKLSLLQLTPTLGMKLTDKLSVGLGVTADIADLQLTPGLVAAPDDANGDGAFSYPNLTNARMRYGIGFRLGAFYQTDHQIDLGFSFKSPQWFEPFEWNATDELGNPQVVSSDVTYPMILSFGAAYRGFEHILLATDVRWIDYANTKLLGEAPVFNPDGAVNGLGWESVWSIGVAGQFQWTERLAGRIAYAYNQNPIPADVTFLSIGAPGVFQHALSMGASFAMTSQIEFSLAWAHGFLNTNTGPLLGPAGAIPGTSVSVTQESDSGIFGVSVLF